MRNQGSGQNRAYPRHLALSGELSLIKPKTPQDKVIDLLLFKGMEELKNIVDHAKQRHHIIGQYVVGRKGLVQDLGPKDEGISNFLKNFYNSNYH